MRNRWYAVVWSSTQGYIQQSFRKSLFNGCLGLTSTAKKENHKRDCTSRNIFCQKSVTDKYRDISFDSLNTYFRLCRRYISESPVNYVFLIFYTKETSQVEHRILNICTQNYLLLSDPYEFAKLLYNALYSHARIVIAFSETECNLSMIMSWITQRNSNNRTDSRVYISRSIEGMWTLLDGTIVLYINNLLLKLRSESHFKIVIKTAFYDLCEYNSKVCIYLSNALMNIYLILHMYDYFYLSTNILHYASVDFVWENEYMYCCQKAKFDYVWNTQEFVHCTQIDDQETYLDRNVKIKAVSMNKSPWTKQTDIAIKLQTYFLEVFV
jgi:hypothetical protein